MDYLYSYLPIVFILAVGVAFGAGSLIFGRLIGPQRPNPSKSLPYESGMIPEGDANVRIPIKFYMVGLIFLLFDIEAVYVLIWAVAFQGKGIDFGSDAIGFTQGQFQGFAFIEMFVFILILMVGYLYVWRKGGFRWS